MVELVKLRQQQQNTRSYLQEMEGRLKRTEQKQRQMMNFLARAVQNPNFVQKLVHQKEWKKELEEAFSKKRRRPIDQGPSSSISINVDLACELECSDFVKLEPQEFGDLDLIENLEEDVHVEKLGIEGKDKEIDEVFWQDLLNDEDVEEDLRGFEEDHEEDVDMLAQQLGYLASSAK